MRYQKVREVDENGIYTDRFVLTIPFSALPNEFLEDISSGSVDLPEVIISENELIIIEEVTHG